MEIHSIAGLDINRLTPLAIAKFGNSDFKSLEQIALMIRIAHCARVSYLNFEGKDDYLADIKLYNQLVSSGHMSPTEHVARAMNSNEYYTHINGVSSIDTWSRCVDELYFDKSAQGWSGNFKGFIQIRKEIEGENKQDLRVIKKCQNK